MTTLKDALSQPKINTVMTQKRGFMGRFFENICIYFSNGEKYGFAQEAKKGFFNFVLLQGGIFIVSFFSIFFAHGMNASILFPAFAVSLIVSALVGFLGLAASSFFYTHGSFKRKSKT